MFVGTFLIKKHIGEIEMRIFLLGQSSRCSNQTSGTEGGFELASSNVGTCRGVALHSTLPDGSSGNPGLSFGLKQKLKSKCLKNVALIDF